MLIMGPLIFIASYCIANYFATVANLSIEAILGILSSRGFYCMCGYYKSIC